VPQIIIVSYFNDIALEWLRKQTGIDFVRRLNEIIGQPETWEQFSKIFLTYNFSTTSVNNWDGNKMYLRLYDYERD
jgi:hypothetical protein